MWFRRFRRLRSRDRSPSSYWEGAVNYPHLSPEDLEEVRELFRRVFDHELGHKVLTLQLIELRFFEKETESQETMVLQNYAKRLLGHCGLWTNVNNLDVVKSMFAIPRKKEK